MPSAERARAKRLNVQLSERGERLKKHDHGYVITRGRSVVIRDGGGFDTLFWTLDQIEEYLKDAGDA